MKTPVWQPQHLIDILHGNIVFWPREEKEREKQERGLELDLIELNIGRVCKDSGRNYGMFLLLTDFTALL